MFTGLVDDVGTIERVSSTAAGREFRISSRYQSIADGESIAVNGACLTVREHGCDETDGWFTVAAVVTTLDRTTIGGWREGQRVNLERALRVGDRLGGHLVQGHVDGVAEVVATRPALDAWLVDLAVPDALGKLFVPHGSVTVDGVSLTVNALPAPDMLQLSLVEYTLRHTTLGDLAVGDRVHVEGDVVGKYIQRLVAPYLSRIVNASMPGVSATGD
jgi:riboflavin synthase